MPEDHGVLCSPPDIPVGVPADILERRPDIAEASFLLRAQTQNIGIAEALRWPSISLTGTLGFASTELDSVTIDGSVWSVGGQLFGPVFDFGQNKRRVEIEELITQQFLFQFENKILNAFREVEDSLVEIKTYREELAAIQRQLKAAKKRQQALAGTIRQGRQQLSRSARHRTHPVFDGPATVGNAATVPHFLRQPLQGARWWLGYPRRSSAHRRVSEFASGSVLRQTHL